LYTALIKRPTDYGILDKKEIKISNFVISHEQISHDPKTLSSQETSLISGSYHT
jgi:hypothetical protein